MDIQDSFNENAAILAGTELTTEEETELHELITDLFKANQLSPDPRLLYLVTAVFVAGRTHQADSETEDPIINVPMSASLASEFMAYLMQRMSS